MIKERRLKSFEREKKNPFKRIVGMLWRMEKGAHPLPLTLS